MLLSDEISFVLNQLNRPERIVNWSSSTEIVAGIDTTLEAVQQYVETLLN